MPFGETVGRKTFRSTHYALDICNDVEFVSHLFAMGATSGRARKFQQNDTHDYSQIKKQNKTGGCVDGSLLAGVDVNELCPPYLPCWWPKSSREDAAMSFVADFQPVRRVMEFAVLCFAFFELHSRR